MSREKASLGRNRTTLEYQNRSSFSCCPSVVEKTTRTGHPVAQGETWKGFSVPLSLSIHIILNIFSNVKKKRAAPAWIIQGPITNTGEYDTLAVAWWRVINATSQLGVWIEKVSSGSLQWPHCHRGISLPSLTHSDYSICYFGVTVKHFRHLFLGYHGAEPLRASQVSLGPYRYHLNPDMLIVTLEEPNVK